MYFHFFPFFLKCIRDLIATMSEICLERNRRGKKRYCKRIIFIGNACEIHCTKNVVIIITGLALVFFVLAFAGKQSHFTNKQSCFLPFVSARFRYKHQTGAWNKKATKMYIKKRDMLDYQPVPADFSSDDKKILCFLYIFFVLAKHNLQFPVLVLLAHSPSSWERTNRTSEKGNECCPHPSNVYLFDCDNDLSSCHVHIQCAKNIKKT